MSYSHVIGSSLSPQVDVTRESDKSTGNIFPCWGIISPRKAVSCEVGQIRHCELGKKKACKQGVGWGDRKCKDTVARDSRVPLLSLCAQSDRDRLTC